MALPPPDDGGFGGPGFGGPGGFGGFGFPGFGKSFNLDYGAGFGFPGFGGGFGGPGGGWGGPYVPVTPLGSLWGFKGDLIVPMVAIGVAIFILIVIVLAVKYALAWKLELLDDLAGNKRPFRRDAGSAPAEHLEDNNLNRMADIVAAAVYSEGCSRRILCEIGAYARESEGKQYTSLIRLMELIVPEEYHQTFMVVRESAEGKFECANNYPCGNVGKTNQTQTGSPDAINEIDVGKGKTDGQKATSPSAAAAAAGAANQTTPGFTPIAGDSPSATTTSAPSVFGKFKRSMFQK